MLKEEVSITNSRNEAFTIDVRYLKERKLSDYENILLICPGFMAFKDWGPFPNIGEDLLDDNIATIVMNYSHNGISKNKNKITDFDKFFENTVSKEIDDILSVIGWIKNYVKENYERTKIVLMGHSRGAANCIVVASNYEVGGLITMSPISNYDRWNNHQKDLWRKNGFLSVSKENSNLKMGIGYLNDLEKNKERYNLTKLAKNIRVPWLIIHGENDVVAKIEEAKLLYEVSDKTNTEFLIIHEMGHMLGYNLYQEFNENIFLKKILNYIKEWLNKNIRRRNDTK